MQASLRGDFPYVPRGYAITLCMACENWLRHAPLAEGAILIDAGAAQAMREKGASLLPGGITGAEGTFRRGDMVQVCWDASQGRVCIARGVSQYAADDVRRIAGRHSRAIQAVLGYNYGGSVVHRDDLVLP